MKKAIISIYIVLAYTLFISSCSPTIRFDVDGLSTRRISLYLYPIEDKRPVNERIGYTIFYVDSISDEDYAEGFVKEFQEGLAGSLEEYFILVENQKDADIVLRTTVHHFYGEYSQTVKTVFWEYGTALLLFIPRLFTDAIPYNSFAGRVAFDLSFSYKAKKQVYKKRVQHKKVAAIKPLKTNHPKHRLRTSL